METELLKWYSVYSENKRLSKEILNATLAFTYFNDIEKVKYDIFCKNQKHAKKQIFKILKKISNENTI